MTRPQYSQRPRPGLDPGPRARVARRRRGEVPGQARDGVILTLLALLLAAPATAQILPTGSPAADILLTQALAEQRVFLTCSALDAGPHAVIRDAWAADAAKAAALLAEKNVPSEAIAAFTAAAAPEALMPEPDTPFADVLALCAGQPDWPERYARLSFTVLALRLPDVFD